MLSLIITHYKTPSLLRRCLDSLKNLNNEVSCEIFVCDSEFEQKTKEMILKDYPWARYLPFKKNVGYGRLVNAGIKKAKGEYYLVLNADIIVNINGIKKMVEYLKQHNDIGILGPKLVNIDGTFQPSCFRWYNFFIVLARRTSFKKTKLGKKFLAHFLMEDYDKKEPRNVDWLMGSAMLMRAAAIKKVGAMDPRFFMYFEDVDLCRRIWEGGYRVVYFPEAQFIHHHLKSSDTKAGILDIFKNRLTRIHILSYLKYSLKWFSRRIKNRDSWGNFNERCSRMANCKTATH